MKYKQTLHDQAIFKPGSVIFLGKFRDGAGGGRKRSKRAFDIFVSLAFKAIPYYKPKFGLCARTPYSSETNGRKNIKLGRIDHHRRETVTRAGWHVMMTSKLATCFLLNPHLFYKETTKTTTRFIHMPKKLFSFGGEKKHNERFIAETSTDHGNAIESLYRKYRKLAFD